MNDYPAPRYPKLLKPSSNDVERKLHALLSRRPGSSLMCWPDYNIVPADKILVVALSEHHPLGASGLTLSFGPGVDDGHQ